MATTRDLYSSSCEKHKCKKNAELLRTLPPSFAEVEELDLATNLVGRNGVKPVLDVIVACNNCKKLSFAGNFLTNESVKDIIVALKGHPGLTYLDLSHNPISHPAGRLLKDFAVCHQVEIVLSDTLINPALVRIIQEAAKVKPVKGAGVKQEEKAEGEEEASKDEAVEKEAKRVQWEEAEQPRHLLTDLLTSAQDCDPPDATGVPEWSCIRTLEAMAKEMQHPRGAGLDLISLARDLTKAPVTDKAEPWWYLRTVTEMMNEELVAEKKQQLVVGSPPGIDVIIEASRRMSGLFAGLQALATLNTNTQSETVSLFCNDPDEGAA